MSQQEANCEEGSKRSDFVSPIHGSVLVPLTIKFEFKSHHNRQEEAQLCDLTCDKLRDLFIISSHRASPSLAASVDEVSIRD